MNSDQKMLAETVAHLDNIPEIVSLLVVESVTVAEQSIKQRASAVPAITLNGFCP